MFKDKYLAGERSLHPYLFSATIFQKNSQFDAYHELKTNGTDLIEAKYIKEEYQCFLKGESKINQEIFLDC